VDGFKQLNDTLGHSFGDQVLVEVTRRLHQTVRASDTLARLSGDEFVVLCSDLTGTSAQIRRWLHVLGRRIQLALRRPPREGEVDIRVSVSIGVMLTGRPHRAADLVQGADRAMYQAKLRGGGQLVISQADIGPAPESPEA
jgi:diguanylate cyclase (GGDEF)-like protein